MIGEMSLLSKTLQHSGQVSWELFFSVKRTRKYLKFNRVEVTFFFFKKRKKTFPRKRSKCISSLSFPFQICFDYNIKIPTYCDICLLVTAKIVPVRLLTGITSKWWTQNSCLFKKNACGRVKSGQSRCLTTSCHKQLRLSHSVYARSDTASM